MIKFCLKGRTYNQYTQLKNLTNYHTIESVIINYLQILLKVRLAGLTYKFYLLQKYKIAAGIENICLT